MNRVEKVDYCCGKNYKFQPKPLTCYGKESCSVLPDNFYFSHVRNSDETYNFCTTCYKEIKEDSITILGANSKELVIKKKDCQAKINDERKVEPVVRCSDCESKFHKICVLHHDKIWHRFTCKPCMEMKLQEKVNPFSAEKLPKTVLSKFIETRVEAYLERSCVRSGKVHIRVVMSSEKKNAIRPGMKAKYFGAAEDVDMSFPYRTKVIYAFQENDGADVAFFALIAQEYGANCPLPNRGRVYIAYLDSVHFFQPRESRTAVYHEIILGYLQYAKHLGFEAGHIWACPPSGGSDYIFYAHPPEQKIPKAKRLQDWYKKLFLKGEADGVIMQSKNLSAHVRNGKVREANQIPYFDGDFWPDFIEKTIEELDKTENLGTNNKWKKKKKYSKRNVPEQYAVENQLDDLMEKVMKEMYQLSNLFMVVRLNPPTDRPCDILDDDPLITCDLMDGRDHFLTLCRDNHYEFSSLRRAKYSTIGMLFELHNKDAVVITCNNCNRKQNSTRYVCKICKEFDLCVECYKTTKHVHELVKEGMLSQHNIRCKAKQSMRKRRQARPKYSWPQCTAFLQQLHHCRTCRKTGGENCKRKVACLKGKHLIIHAQACVAQLSGNCPLCSRLSNVIWGHTKFCKDNACGLPFCMSMKRKFRARMMVRIRAKLLNNSSVSSAAVLSLRATLRTEPVRRLTTSIQAVNTLPKLEVKFCTVK